MWTRWVVSVALPQPWLHTVEREFWWEEGAEFAEHVTMVLTAL